MALKEFTKEGRFESGMDDVVKGKTWCFVAIADNGASLGIAVANEPGYHPISKTWCRADTYAEMDAHADKLNEEEGLDARAAFRIVTSTMAAQNILEHHV